MPSKLFSQVKLSEFLIAFIQEMENNISLGNLFKNTLDLICNYLSFSSSCLILEKINLRENSEVMVNNYYFSSNSYSLHKNLKILENIIQYHQPCLIKNNYILLNNHLENLPLKFSTLRQDCHLNFLLLIPVIYRTKYLATLICHHENCNYQLTEEKINLLKAVATQYGIVIHQTQLEIALKQQEKINANLQISASKNEYLLQMNHELRTPMTAIIGFAKMLQKQIYGALNPKQMQYITEIYDSGIYLLELINDLLDITKLEANKEELFIEKIQVKEICQASLSLVEVKAQEQELSLNLVIDNEINYCYADARKLKQILVNLLSNAVKFTEKGGVTLKVEKKLKNLTFSIIDTGIGIKKSDQEKLFKPFVQLPTHANQKHKGSGLGLALSIKLARLQGGDITLISEEGKGSCFTYSFPLIS